MKKFSLVNLMFNVVVCLFITSVGYSMVGTPAIAVGSVLFMSGFIPHDYYAAGALRNEVIRKVFSSDLQKNLYPDNSFYKGNAKVDSGVAIDAESVDIPQAGLPPKVLKNPEVRPIPMRVRKDDKKTYGVDLFETQPDLITNINQDLVTYDKRAAVLEDHISQLNTRIADEIAIRWSPTKADNIIRTTGTGNTGSKIAGMSGTRKEVTYKDLIAICALLDRMEVPDDGRRCLLIYSDIINLELKAISEIKDYDKTGIAGVFASGAIGRLQNMNVYKRTSVPIADTNGFAKPYGSLVAGNDNLFILAWHPSFVRYAEGASEVYMDTTVKPGMGGKTMNAAVRGGATPNRLDERGIVALVQG